MSQSIHAGWSYLKYLCKRRSAHSIHSPFVFKLYNEAIKDRPKLSVNIPENVRKQLLKNDKEISLHGFGAGSRSYSVNKIKVNKHAKHSLKGKKESELFYRIVKYLQPNHILELGTSFGVSTLYLREAVPKASITTIEGESEIQNIAIQHFEGKNIISHLGDIDKLLPQLLSDHLVLDCVVFDANHSYEPTMAYFEQCLVKAHNDSFFIVDDIYWSKGMTKAWEEIKKDPRVKVSIDLYYFGIVFFRKEQKKEDFILRQFQLIN